MLHGVRTTYLICFTESEPHITESETTYLPVENLFLAVLILPLLPLTESEPHIYGVRTTYFCHFTESEPHI